MINHQFIIAICECRAWLTAVWQTGLISVCTAHDAGLVDRP